MVGDLPGVIADPLRNVTILRVGDNPGLGNRYRTVAERIIEPTMTPVVLVSG